LQKTKKLFSFYRRLRPQLIAAFFRLSLFFHAQQFRRLAARQTHKQEKQKAGKP
jgi:hypothetical protein